MKYLLPVFLLFGLSVHAQESKLFTVDGKVETNYKVVLSWNEVFNSKSDNNILLLTSFDANPAKAEKGNIAMIVSTDNATGRRFVKGLSRITILQAN